MRKVKLCRACRKTLPIALFSKGNCKLGRHWCCKPCFKKKFDTKEQKHARNLKSKYGLSLNEYATMKAVQRNLCAICASAKKLVVDHCHITQKVRGLLCYQCNSAIGGLKDDARVVASALSYLTYHLQVNPKQK